MLPFQLMAQRLWMPWHLVSYDYWASANGMFTRIGYFQFHRSALAGSRGTDFELKSTHNTGVEIGLTLMQLRCSPRLSAYAGIQWEFNKYNFENELYFSGTDYLTYSVMNFGKKSYLRSSYFNVPFQLVFSPYNNDKSVPFENGFSFSLGVKPGVRIGNAMHYTKNGLATASKEKLDYDRDMFKLSYTASVEFYGLSLNVEYAPKSMFSHGDLPDMRQVNIGIRMPFTYFYVPFRWFEEMSYL